MEPKSGKAPSRLNNKRPPVYSSAKNVSATLFNSFDHWLDKKSKPLVVFILGLSVLFSLFLFQARMDIGGDDSGYVLRAYDFIHKGVFPSFQGPLYPIFLSVFISFSGLKVVLLKTLSLILNFIALLFFYKAFKGRIPAFVLFFTLLLIAINSYILNYASQTYSEAFFMALQFIFFYYFFRLLDKLKTAPPVTLKNSWRSWLGAGLLLYLLIAAKNVGIIALGGLILYFAIPKNMNGKKVFQFQYILYLIGAYLVFYFPISVIEKLVWHVGNQFGSQGSWFFLKNPYNLAKGNENISGFILRFFTNCDMYLSDRLYQILGFRAETQVEPVPALTYLTVLLLIISIFRVFRSKNNYMLAATVYVISMMAMTFFILQADPAVFSWFQPARLIIVFVPFLLLLFLFGLYDLLKKSGFVLQFLGVGLTFIIVIFEFNATLTKSKENIPVISKNLKGDIYYGFPPGWANYLKLSAWCENLPKDSLVAVRKGPMSTVYCNGRPFFNVSKIDEVRETNADSAIAYLKRYNVRYIMLANLSMGNTMERLIAPIAKKYPQMLRLVKQEGDSEDDVAQLWEINY